MPVVDLLVLAGLVAVGVTFAAWLVWAGIEHAKGQPFDVVFDDGEEDENATAPAFLSVLKHAKRKLIVHDDGDNTSTSIFNDTDVVEAVKRQLDDNQKLVIACLFNVRENLMTVKSLGGHERFRVKYRRWRWSPSAFDVHYTIADDGSIGRLSHLGKGAKKRRFEIRNCLNARQSERNIEFGRYMRRFEHQFLLAKPA